MDVYCSHPWLSQPGRELHTISADFFLIYVLNIWQNISLPTKLKKYYSQCFPEVRKMHHKSTDYVRVI